MKSSLDGAQVRLIVNGQAQISGKLKRSLKKATRDLGRQNVTVETMVTDSPLAAEELAAEACSKDYAAVVAVGGDGTLHQVINGVMQQRRGIRSEIVVGVIPAGTANDFAAGLGIEKYDAYQTLMALNSESVRWLDLGKVESRYFINFASGGFGAEATRGSSALMKTLYGAEAYALNGVRRMLDSSACRGTFKSKDWQWEGRFLTFAIGNGSQAGGGCVMCSKAQLDDGELDLCIIPAHVEIRKLLYSWVNGPVSTVKNLLLMRNPLRYGVISYLLEYYKKVIVRKRVSALDIQLEHDLPLSLDGETSGALDKFRVRVLPHQIRFLA